MAAYYLDDAPLPPLLRQAFDLKSWGGDVSRMPANVLRPMSMAYNAYRALDGYMTATGHTVEWGKRNPKAWEFVANVIADRKGLPR